MSLHLPSVDSHNSPRASSPDDYIIAWKNSSVLTLLLDDSSETCASFPPDDPVLLLVAVDRFASTTVRVFSQNLHLDKNGCESPLIVASHNSESPLGQAPCRPVCDGLLRCQRKDPISSGVQMFSDFVCSCGQASCRGVIVAFQPSTVIDRAQDVSLCHIQEVNSE